MTLHRTTKMHVDAVRAAADASRDANENIPEKSDLHFGDPMDFWIKQVTKTSIISIRSIFWCISFRTVPQTSRLTLPRLPWTSWLSPARALRLRDSSQQLDICPKITAQGFPLNIWRCVACWRQIKLSKFTFIYQWNIVCWIFNYFYKFIVYRI